MPRVTPSPRGSGSDPPPSRTVTKPLLIAVSHAIEEFAAAAAANVSDGPVVVVAMFQRPLYFAREVEPYSRIGRVAALTVAGMSGPAPADVPAGVTRVPLDDDEALAREWSVTVLGPRSGASLVAWDLERIDGTARSLEHGRTFSGWWSFRRSTARAQMLRLRAELGDRMPSGRAAVLDDLLAPDTPGTPETTGPHGTPGTGEDLGVEAAMTVLVDRLADELRTSAHTRNHLDAVEPGAERDPHSGLPTRAFLDRWTAGSAPGTLPLGLVLFRVHELSRIRRRHGVRAERDVLESIARILRRQAAGADRAIRVGREEFLLVLPSRDREQLARWTERARAEIGALSGTHPFVPTPASAVITLTRDRPLPLGPLWAALDRAVETGIPVTVLGP